MIAVQCQSDSLIICNGYKDQSYIELALLAQKMGKRIFIVVEKLNEINVITHLSEVHIILCSLVESRLNTTNLRNLWV